MRLGARPIPSGLRAILREWPAWLLAIEACAIITIATYLLTR
jgi:hypothetical protein